MAGGGGGGGGSWGGKGKRSNGGGGEDLEGLLWGLKLSEEERSKIRGSRRPEGGGEEQAPQAVAKLFASKAGNADGLAQALGRIWCPGQGIRCKDLGKNLFHLTFLQAGGKRRAIMEGPWEFGGDLLVVTDFDRNKRLKDFEFTHIPIWVRVFDLPLGMMDSTNGVLLGDRIGKTLEVDTEEDGSAVGGFLRIKVKIDIRKPLRRGVLVEGEDGEEDCWCPVRYEFIPNFCYGCGRLGHVEKGCDSCVEVEGGCRQFGEWMRVTPSRWKGQGDQRSKWSDGETAGSGKFRKSKESGRTSLVMDRAKRGGKASDERLGGPKQPTFEVGSVTAELGAGTGEALLGVEGGKHGFEEEQAAGYVGEQSLAAQSQNIAGVEVVQTGEVFLEEGKDMEVDGGAREVLGAGEGSLPVGEQGTMGGLEGQLVPKDGIGGGLGLGVEGGGRKPGSFCRVLRAQGNGGGSCLEKERKRSRGEEEERELDHKRKKLMGAVGEEQDGKGDDVLAGLADQSCPTK